MLYCDSKVIGDIIVIGDLIVIGDIIVIGDLIVSAIIAGLPYSPIYFHTIAG